ncbi:heme exporter protein CcmD [Aurantiacibacter gangjinensis]|uniref:heme exporter protein CcmD n=1 Tax=Aurantiacibacter gangjinensis TaxID=502682 RepID=UPI00090CBCE7|nr:heme exporter protein CcmD [Aurantiacibacter gangjinensis]APE29002.1 hypothetical protein BMF35_a2173 [Aurantiacibacter gangjinensis]
MRESLDHMLFVNASYAVTIVAMLALVIGSWIAMRRAETRRDRAKGSKARGK